MSSANQLATRPPLKCKPLPDEWVETLLGRIARRMGIRRPWKYDLDRLRPLLPLDLHGLNLGEIRYGRDPLPKWALLGPRAQINYCPACFTASRHIRGRWRIAQLTVCTLHSLTLKSGLAEPAITSGYQLPGRHAIVDITPEQAWEGATCPTPRAKAHLKKVWSQFEASVQATAPDTQIADALAWALLSERLVDAACRSIRGPDYPADGTPAHEHRADWLARHGLAIQANRLGVSSFLQGLPLPAHRRAVVSALTRLVNDEQRHRTVMSRLPLQELKDTLLAVSAAAPERGFGALPRARHPKNHASFEAAEALIGCEPGLLYHLIRSGLIQGVQRIPHGRKNYVFIPEDEVRRYRRYFANCWTYSQLLDALSIDRRSYWLLRQIGFIAPDEIGSWRRYPKSSICTLLSAFEAVSRPASTAKGELLPLLGEWLFKSRRPIVSVAALLKEVLAGRVPIYRDLTGRGLAAFQVTHEATLRLGQLSSMTIAQAARSRANDGQLELGFAA